MSETTSGDSAEPTDVDDERSGTLADRPVAPRDETGADEAATEIRPLDQSGQPAGRHAVDDELPTEIRPLADAAFGYAQPPNTSDHDRRAQNHDDTNHPGNHHTSDYTSDHDTANYAGDHDTSNHNGDYDTSGYDSGDYAGDDLQFGEHSGDLPTEPPLDATQIIDPIPADADAHSAADAAAESGPPTQIIDPIPAEPDAETNSEADHGPATQIIEPIPAQPDADADHGPATQVIEPIPAEPALATQVVPASELPPLLVAEGLGIKGGRGWVFQDVSLTVPAAGLLAIAGPPGSGRTMLLLTLAGRAKPTSGRLTIDDTVDAKAIRAAVAVARITGLAEPEPELRVGDHVKEARALSRHGLDFAWARDVVGFTAPGHALVTDLDGADVTLLSVALAVAGRPQAIVLDDVDQRVDPDQLKRIWAALADVATQGIAVVASCADPAAATTHGALVHILPAAHRDEDEDFQ